MIAGMALLPNPLLAYNPIPKEPTVLELPFSSSTLPALIEHYAEQYDVSPRVMTAIVQCESGGDPNAKNITKREHSLGLVQINLFAHASVSEKEAFDPFFSLDFLAKNLSKGRGWWWTCLPSWSG